MNTLSILIIDDCDNFRLVASDILLDQGHVVEQANCPHDAFEILDNEKFDVILCDLHMPFMNGPRNHEFQTSYQVGIMTINELQKLFPETVVIGLTSTCPDDLLRIKSALKGIKAYTKPSSKEELMAILARSEILKEINASMQ